ncbi:MAG: hypothetical protein IJQ08_07535 [Synergistaceae bacterium]|nr:hypothetical protein [Synergistaceae bacterium]
MTKKTLIPALILAVILASSAFAIPNPPSKGQWAYPLEEYMSLYRRADRNSRSEEIRMPQKWISVPSAVRDDDNYLWYKVTVNGKTGWLAQNGILLKMGPKSKSAANLYRKYRQARRKIMDRTPKEWSSYVEDGATVYETQGRTGDASFKVIEGRRGVEDVHFSTSDYRICREFLGVDLIGWSQPEVRSKLGTPTLRETPYDTPEYNFLYFEIDGSDMTLSVLERREGNDTEGTVYRVEIFEGRVGD